jgi:hypothetical protein
MVLNALEFINRFFRCRPIPLFNRDN